MNLVTEGLRGHVGPDEPECAGAEAIFAFNATLQQAEPRSTTAPSRGHADQQSRPGSSTQGCRSSAGRVMAAAATSRLYYSVYVINKSGSISYERVSPPGRCRIGKLAMSLHATIVGGSVVRVVHSYRLCFAWSS